MEGHSGYGVPFHLWIVLTDGKKIYGAKVHSSNSGLALPVGDG
jgi:hypothetical protein